MKKYGLILYPPFSIENQLYSALTHRLNLLIENLQGSGVPLNLYDSVKLRFSIAMTSVALSKRLSCLETSLCCMFDSTDTDNKVRCYLQQSKELIADILNKGYQEPLLMNFFVQWVSRVTEVSTREFSSDPRFEYLQRILNYQLALPSADEKSEENCKVPKTIQSTIQSTNWQKTYLNQILSGKGQAIIDTLLYFAQCSCQEFTNLSEFVKPDRRANSKKKVPLSPQPRQFPYLILAEAVETGQKTWVNLAWKLFCKDSYKSILSLYDANETAG
ncbi:hypothetical protein RFI_35702, partial [Reticulomyxa filosa]